MDQHQTGTISFNKAKIIKIIELFKSCGLLCCCTVVLQTEMTTWMEAQPSEGLSKLFLDPVGARAAPGRTAAELWELSGYPGIESCDLSAVDLTGWQHSWLFCHFC